MGFRRMQGYKRMPTGREAIRMMQKMGVNVEEIKNVMQVSIKTDNKNLIIENPTVTIVMMQGQKMFQIVGGEEKEEIPEDVADKDALLVAEQTGKSLEEARIALQDEEGDIAKAILKLKRATDS